MSGSNPQSVLVVDDHPFIRASIVQELERDGTYRVCGEAGSAAEALALLRRIRPDFAILDLSLEEGSGMEILAYLQEHCPDCLPVVVTMHEEPAYIEQALQGGARGYIFKRESVQSVRQALREVRAGRIFMSQRVAQVLLQHQAKDKRTQSLEQTLSGRELEIFEKIGLGYTRAQLAEELCISARTVDSHLDRIKTKLECQRMAHLTRLAVQYQLAKANR